MIDDWLYANFDVVNHSGGGELTVCCPFCDNDTKFHMYISTSKPVAHCFKCGWAGTHFQLVREVSGTESYAEVWRQIKSPNTMGNYQTVVERLQQRRHTGQVAVLEDMPDWFQPLAGTLLGKSKHGHWVLSYALTRLSMDEIVQYGMGYCADPHSPYAMRLIIPIERGYFQARAIAKIQEPKYLNTEFPIEDRLFNYRALDYHKHVYICEGAISAIALGQTAVATLGANGATEQQRRRLLRSNVELFTLVVEPEPVAKAMAIALADYLIAYNKPVIFRTYAQGDPANSMEYTECAYTRAYALSI